MLAFIVAYAVLATPHGNDSIAAADSGAARTTDTESPAQVAQTQPPAVPTPRPTATPSPTPPTIYVVRAGDSYSMIARNFNISMDQLLQANHLTVENIPHPGDQLIIP